MKFDPQPHLKNELITLRPLRPEDFDTLFDIASDPLIWEQHPNNDRYKKDVFQQFFDVAIAGSNSLAVMENITGKIIGTSRYYDFEKTAKTTAIGYTFIGRDFWGKGYNGSLKKLMLDYAFLSADQVIFHVGKSNYRSQKAVEKLGGILIGEEVSTPPLVNLVYEITKTSWQSRIS